jgi:hypothetical protein
MAWRNRGSIKWVLLVIGVILVKAAASSPIIIEKFYASGFYPVSSRLQRWLLGWLPFSVGDILYLLAGLWLLWSLVRTIRYLRSKNRSREKLQQSIGRIISIIIVIYLLFNGLWGLNYNRNSPASRLGLTVADSATAPELAQITEILLSRTNQSRPRKMINFKKSKELAIHLFETRDHWK